MTPVNRRTPVTRGLDSRLVILNLADYPDDVPDAVPPPDPPVGSIGFRCLTARRVIPGLQAGTVGRIARLTSGHYHRIERGTKVPTVEIIRKVALGFQALGVDVTAEWLAFDVGRKPRKVRKKRERAPDLKSANP